MISKIMINVVLISIFITIFFFTYGVKIEKEVIINQMKILTNDFMSHVELSGNSINKNINELNNELQNEMSLPENRAKIIQTDKDELSGNKKISSTVLVCIFGLICVTAFIMIIFTSSGAVQNVKEILLESIIILLSIALTEFCFIFFLGAKYVSIDTNHIKLNVVKFLQKYSKSSNDEPIDEHDEPVNERKNKPVNESKNMPVNEPDEEQVDEEQVDEEQVDEEQVDEEQVDEYNENEDNQYTKNEE